MRIPSCLLVLTTLTIQAVSAQDQRTPTWPQFRGPGGLATAPKQHVPDTFGAESNVLWKVKVPNGHSSPCIWGDLLFLTGHEGEKLLVLCYSRVAGRLLWKKEIKSKGKETLGHKDSSPAAPTACTDGKRVYAYFGAYGLVALDIESQETVWDRTWPIRSEMFGTGSSPILHGGKLYLCRDVSGVSRLYCFDAESGDEVWVTLRRRMGTNYSTPFIWSHGDEQELVVPGTTVLKSYSLEDGEPIWWVKNLTVFSCPSPTGDNEQLYFGGWSTPNEARENRLASGFDEDAVPAAALKDTESLIAHCDKNQDGKLQLDEVPRGRAKDAFAMMDFNKNGAWDRQEIDGIAKMPVSPGRNVLVAIRAGGKGDVTDSHVVWEKRRGIPYVASPLVYRGRVYFIKKGGFVSCVDAKTGDGHYERKRLGEGGEYYATPVGVGDRVFIGSARGTMFVLDAGDDLKIIAKNELGEGIFATPAAVDDTLYVRTQRHLWAFGTTKTGKASGKTPR